MLSEKYIKQLLSPVFGVIATLFLLLTAVGCSKELGVDESLEISNLNPVIQASGGAVTLEVSSNASWKVGEINASWLHVENTAGSGDGQLRLWCDENDAVESRTAEFFVVTTKDGKYHKITFTQLADDPFIEIEEEVLEVGSRPRSHAVNLNTNIPAAAIRAEVLYEEEGDSWVVGVNVESGLLKFQTILNTLPDERTATIILSYEDVSGTDLEVWDKITVTQMSAGNDGPPEVKEYSYVQALPLGVIDENISVMGNIVSTGVSANFRAGTYIIQNDNGIGLAFEPTGALSLNRYDKVHLLLDGAEIETFEDCGVTYRVIKGISTANILTSEADAGFTPPTMRISELTDDHLLSVVTLPDVEFAVPHGGYTNFHEFYMLPAQQVYAATATAHYPAPIRDIHGSDMYLITNREVAYRRNSVPKGAGNITGLVVKITNSEFGYLGDYSLRHLAEEDIALNPNRANGLSEILVEWEFQDQTALQATLPAASTAPGNPGHPFLPPTTPTTGDLVAATLKKQESSGIYQGYTASGGMYLIDKYRGDKPMADNSIIARGNYNVNNWGTGKYWIIENVSTLGITSSLSVQFESNSSPNNGPRDFAVEYSLNGNSWTRIATYSVFGQMSTNGNERTHTVPSLKMFTYSLPDECLNKPEIKIRLLNISNATVNGGNLAVSGTNRLGYFSIKYNK